MTGRKKEPDRVYLPNWGGRRKGSGQKKMLSGHKTTQFVCYLRPYQMAALKKWCARRGTTMSAMARKAIYEYIRARDENFTFD